MSSDTQSSIDAWTAYWRTGRGASCVDGSDTEVRLTKVWDEFVDELSDGARLLDLATGNGTVARICAARARTRKIKLRIEAVDAARIDPPKFAADPAQLFGDIRFHGQVRAEALPFPDADFDGVVSQFGFEYADEEPAVAEIARVLAPGGRLRLVVHARNGAVSRDIGGRMERLQCVLAEHGAVTLIRTLARAAEAGDAATVQRESAHLAAAAELVRKLADRPPSDDSALFYSTEFLREWGRRDRYRPSDLRRSIEQGWTNANGVAARYGDMLRVARSAEEMSRLANRFVAAGLAVDTVREISDQRRGVQIAWLVHACKPAE